MNWKAEHRHYVFYKMLVFVFFLTFIYPLSVEIHTHGYPLYTILFLQNTMSHANIVVHGDFCLHT